MSIQIGIATTIAFEFDEGSHLSPLNWLIARFGLEEQSPCIAVNLYQEEAEEESNREQYYQHSDSYNLHRSKPSIPHPYDNGLRA